MARIRSLKAEYFDDEDVGRVSRDARLLFLGLWPQADREGRLEDRPARLKVRIFPYDEDVDGATVNGLLDELQTSGFILRYSADGQALIQIRSFVKHQRPHPREPESLFPAPDSREKTRPAVEIHGTETELLNENGAVEKHGLKCNDAHPPYPDPVHQIPDPRSHTPVVVVQSPRGYRTLDRPHIGHVFCSERLCVGEKLHLRVVQRIGSDAKAKAWYPVLADGLTDADLAETDDFKLVLGKLKVHLQAHVVDAEVAAWLKKESA